MPFYQSFLKGKARDTELENTKTAFVKKSVICSAGNSCVAEVKSELKPGSAALFSIETSGVNTCLAERSLVCGKVC